MLSIDDDFRCQSWKILNVGGRVDDQVLGFDATVQTCHSFVAVSEEIDGGCLKRQLVRLHLFLLLSSDF